MLPFVHSVAAEDLKIEKPFKQIKHDFWIEPSKGESYLDYELTQLELLTGELNENSRPIELHGNLLLRSRISAAACQVRLPSNQLEALHVNGRSKILLRLSGAIGDKQLDLQPVNPSFNEYNQAHFYLHAELEPSSLAYGMEAGEYSFEDDLKLEIDFIDLTQAKEENQLKDVKNPDRQ